MFVGTGDVGNRQKQETNQTSTLVDLKVPQQTRSKCHPFAIHQQQTLFWEFSAFSPDTALWSGRYLHAQCLIFFVVGLKHSFVPANGSGWMFPYYVTILEKLKVPFKRRSPGSALFLRPKWIHQIAVFGPFGYWHSFLQNLTGPPQTNMSALVFIV